MKQEIAAFLQSAVLENEGGIGVEFWKQRGYQRVVLYIMTCVSVLFLLKYILPYFLPLAVALLIVVPLQRFCIRAEEKRRAKGKRCGLYKSNGKGVMAGGILFGIILVVALIIVGIGTFLISRARNVVRDVGFITDSVSEIISDTSVRIEEFWGFEEGAISRWIDVWVSDFAGSLAHTGDGFLSGSLRYLSVAGHVGTFILVSFICVVLFAREVERWQQGLLNLAALEPAIDRLLSILIRIGKKLGGMIKTYAKTQSIILVCISVTAAIGLYIGGVKDAYSYGILAGVMDFLPFIGTGIVLIPIGVVQFIRGKIFGGIAVITTYIICVLIRELLEPRLLGNGLRFSPVAVLIAVYAGVLFYGIGGVVLGPVTLLILVELGKEMFW
ncbi:AI-2E family transporter [Lachnospiraceae bacterium MD335]|nr:AI-2E family transporter [Lachnospiraceae bacterium MD335]